MPLFKLGTGAGGVTSVALTAPAIFSVSGSPITTAGTLALALVTQAANLVWAGPTSGAAANPTFRSLVAADFPAPVSTFANLSNAAGFLKNDGSGVLSWASVSVTPGGSDTQVQFNDGGAFGGVSGFVFDKVTRNLYLSGTANPLFDINQTNTSTPINIAFDIGAVNKATVGVAATAGQGVSGSSAGTLFLKAASSTVELSKDDGTTVGFRLKTTNLIQLPGYGVGTLRSDASGNISASTTIGTGDFVGPSSATDNAVVRFDGTTGKLGQNSLLIVADSGDVTMSGSDSSGGFFGYKATNTDSTGQATLSAFNNAGNACVLSIYGSSFPTVALRNQAVFSGTLGLQFISSGGVSSGGSDNIDFISGGYANNFTARITAGNPGHFLLGSATDDGATLFQAKVSTMTNSIGIGAGGSGITAYGLLSFNGSRTLAATLGVLGGASGDDKILYLAAPSTGQFQFFVNGSNVGTLDSSGNTSITGSYLNHAQASPNILFGRGYPASGTDANVVIDFYNQTNPSNSGLVLFGMGGNSNGWAAPIQSAFFLSSKNGSGTTLPFAVWAQDGPTSSNMAFYVPANSAKLLVGGMTTSAGTYALQVKGAMWGDTTLTIDNSSASAYSDYKISGTRKGLIGAANTTDALITGSVAGDFCLRTPGNFLVSTDDGSTIALKLNTSRALRLPAYTTAGLLSNDTSGNVTTATAGTSLSLSSGVLNTIQDIRTSATPTWVGVNGASGLVLKNAGTQAVLIDASANVIVGNQAVAGAMLDIQTASGTASTFRLFQNGVSNWVFSVPASTDALIFSQYGTTERARFDSAGNFGVGGTPAVRLHAKAGGPTRGIVSKVENSSSGTTGAFQSLVAVGANVWSFGLPSGSADLVFYTGRDESADGTETVRFESGGNVKFAAGVKTANPSGGTAQYVKFGSYVGGAPTATGYQQVEINGTAYKVLVST